jgi:hypothetical protein
MASVPVVEIGQEKGPALSPFQANPMADRIALAMSKAGVRIREPSDAPVVQKTDETAK